MKEMSMQLSIAKIKKSGGLQSHQGHLANYIRSQFSQNKVWFDLALPQVALYKSFSTFSSDSQRLQHNLVFLPPAPRSKVATLGDKWIACRFAWCSWMLLLSIFLLHFFHSCFCCSLGLGIRLTHKASSALERLQARSFLKLNLIGATQKNYNITSAI